MLNEAWTKHIYSRQDRRRVQYPPLDIEAQIGNADSTLAHIKDDIKKARKLRNELKKDIADMKRDRDQLMIEIRQLSRQRDALAS